MLRTLAETAARLVFPPACEICRSPLKDEGLCRTCQGKLRFLEPPFCSGCGRTIHHSGTHCSQCAGEDRGFDRAYACAVYEGAAKDLLGTFKFHGRKQLKTFFSDRMISFLRTHTVPASFTSVAAVPMETARRRQRGFNQSELLAGEIARRLELRHDSPRLWRDPSGNEQHRLGKKERGQNVRGVFRADRGAFRDQRVVLIDDVMTTGETCGACARTLKRAGALSVTALVFARGL